MTHFSGCPQHVLPSVQCSQYLMHCDEDQGDVDQKSTVCEEMQASLGVIPSEERENGVVRLAVYKTYWMAVGKCLALSVLVSLFLMQGMLAWIYA